ncbi:MAG TPA: VOC family protein [Terriglobales bacterium]|jgi:PhnB protein
MKPFTPYINFPGGQCRPALEFYAQVFGATTNITTFAEGPADIPTTDKNFVLHGQVIKNGVPILMASDCTVPGFEIQKGNGINFLVELDTAEEQDRLFSALSEGGKVSMPLQNTFWGSRFGMVSDKFGTQWMLSVPASASVESGQHQHATA